MPANVARFRCGLEAVDLFDVHAPKLGFRFEERTEGPPADIDDMAGKPSIFKHVPNIESLDRNHRMRPDEFGCEFVEKVQPDVSNPAVESGDSEAGLLIVSRSFDEPPLFIPHSAARKFPLKPF